MGQRFLFRLTAVAVAIALVVLGAGVAWADDVVADLVSATSGSQITRDLGSVAPGATLTPPVSFELRCGTGNNHINEGQTITLSRESATLNGSAAGTAVVTASNATIGPIPATWIDDGNNNCGTLAPLQDNGDSTVTIVAPSTSGNYTVTLTFSATQEVTDSAALKFPSPTVTFTFSVAGKTNQTITFAQPASPKTFGDTFGVNPTASSGLPVTVEASGGCTVSPSTAPATVTMTSGTTDCSLTASQTGNASFNPATNVVRTVAAVKAEQAALTVSSPTSGTYGDKLTPTASGGSGTGAVTFAATGDACSIPSSGDDAGKLLITSGTGSCSIEATRAGDADYLPRTSPAQAVTVSKAAQAALTVTGPDSGKYNETKSMTSSGGSGTGAVTFEVKSTSTACEIQSGGLRITTGTGLCEIRATKATDSNYNAATSEWHQVAVSKDSAELSLSGLSHTYNGSPQGATVTTDPAGLTGVTVTYNGSSTVPTDAGSYAVVASLDNSNYSSENAVGTLVIDPKNVDGSFTAADKTYDGTTAATINGGGLDEDDIVGADDVSLDDSGASATFEDADAGEDKTVTGTGFALAGAAAGNYTLVMDTTTEADIDPKNVDGSFTAADKTYDGTTAATINGGGLDEDDIVGDDDVSLDDSGASATFEDADAGEDKTVTGTGFALAGTAARNYTLVMDTTTEADIDPAPLTITASSPETQVIGSPVPTITPTYGGFVNGETTDTLTTAPTCGTTYTTASDVGEYATSCSGAAAANYEIDYVDGSFNVVFSWSGFLQPVNNTRKGQIQSKFKLGSTIPVKFRLLNSSGQPVQQSTLPRFEKVKLSSGCDSTTVVETETVTTSTAGDEFRWDAFDQQYVYNFKTKGLTGGEWRIKAILADGTVGNYSDVCIK